MITQNILFKYNINIYVLYIPKRINYIKEIVKKKNLNPIYIQGPLKDNYQINEFIKHGILKKNTSLNIGRICCHLGHLKILYNFLKTDKNHAIIMEDDIQINNSDFNKKINNIVENIPNDADLIYFTYCYENINKIKKYSDIFYEAYRPECRTMYLVTRKAAKIILNKTIPMYMPGDTMIALLIKAKILKCYLVNQDYLNIKQDRIKNKSNSNNYDNQCLYCSNYTNNYREKNDEQLPYYKSL